MTTLLEGIAKNDLANAVSNSPVEIWQEIIDQLLWDPAIFSFDPFYPGCNLHSALDEWHDRNRASAHEVQRGTLRLVSRSWKALADASLWQYFEPQPWVDNEQRLAQCLSASRLQLRPICPLRKCESNNIPCFSCQELMQGIHSSLFSKDSLEGDPLRCSIFEMPKWEEYPTFGTFYSPDHTPHVHLRALTATVHPHAVTDFLRQLPNLTFLNIHIREPWDQTDEAPVLPNLKILQLDVDLERDGAFLKRWDLPILAHLAIKSPYMHDNRADIFEFLEMSGAHLVSLRLSIQKGWVYLPAGIWEKFPLLEYVGITAMVYDNDNPLTGRPSYHPLHTLGITEDDQISFRTMVAHGLDYWGSITRIADCHYWKNMPEAFQFTESFDHAHKGSPCWRCVGALRAICHERALRYEDQTGKTLEEFKS